MRTFTKLIAPALIATLGIGGMTSVASAQPGPHRGPQQAAFVTPQRNAQIRHEIQGLSGRITHAQATRAISPRDAAGLHQQASAVQRLYTGYARGGLNGGEMRDLQNRIDRINAGLQGARHDRDGHRR